MDICALNLIVFKRSLLIIGEMLDLSSLSDDLEAAPISRC